MTIRKWKIAGIVAALILLLALIFAPWPKDESPDPVANGVNGPAFTTPLKPGYGVSNPFH